MAYFDGRSWTTNALHYSLTQRVVVLIATHVMPLLTLLVMSNRLNTVLWKLLGCRVGAGSIIRMGTKINAPFCVFIGEGCLIHGELKSRGGIRIGHGVELVEDVLLSTQSHNTDSELFESIYAPITIEDYAWVGPRSIVLKGVKVEQGTVIAAGAVVTKSTNAWSVYAGVPAIRRKKRVPLKRHTQ